MDIQGPSELVDPNYTGSYRPTVILEQEEAANFQQLTQLELFWRRFRAHKLALLGVGTIILLVLMAIFAPLITPGITPTTVPYLIGVPLGGPAHPPTFDNFPWRIFGTTNFLNHSILAQITYGARVSLTIGFVAALLSSTIGTVVGAISGYFGGWVDNLIMRITDIFLSIPALPLLIAVAAIYAQGNMLIIIAIFTILSWTGAARQVRASFLSLREQEFAEAAKAAGVNDWRIIFRHLLPNALSPVIVITTLNVASFIVGEATLDFLGLGVNFPPTATWGNILSDAQNDILNGDWWWATFPGIFLVITVLAVNFIGDGLRDALDVRTRIEG
jgi:peptide/nickel transport system permease protein